MSASDDQHPDDQHNSRPPFKGWSDLLASVSDADLLAARAALDHLIAERGLDPRVREGRDDE